MKDKPLICVENLYQSFPVFGGFLRKDRVVILKAISLEIEEGKTLGIVGESGCGKTTLGRTILRLQEPAAGKIHYEGTDITKVKMLPYRKKMQLIFQDPLSSLDPRMTAMDSIGEAIDVHRLAESQRERRERIFDALAQVGLGRAYADRFPHELSGGQQQRIGIARALAVEPRFIVCDEPVSSLDAAIRGDIMDTLEERQREHGLTYLFIAHDLSVVGRISDHIAVMYLGKIVEYGTVQQVYENPGHPYTQALIDAVMVPGVDLPRRKRRWVHAGDVPGFLDLPSGCRYHTRCQRATAHCREEEPELRAKDNGHRVACHIL